MQKKHNTSQFGTTFSVWLLQALKALQFTTKLGRKAKSISTQISLYRAPTKFTDRIAKSDKRASFTYAPASSVTALTTETPATMALLPAGKLREVVRFLGQDGGASIDDLMALTGWQRHTVRAALCRLRQRGFVITANQHNGRTIYTLQQRQ